MQQEIKELQKRDDLREIRDQLTEYPNCFGTAISYRKRGGSFDYNDPCVVAYVEEKLSDDELDAESTIPREINSVSVDVRQRDRNAAEPISEPHPDYVSEFIASPLRIADMRPMMGGFMNQGVNDVEGATRGTINSFLIETSSGDSYGLTAGHVAASISTVYQPYEDTNQSDNNEVGDVQYHEGFTSDDYAFYPTNDTSHTNHIAGAGAIDRVAEPSFGQRLIAGGMRNGLHGGQLEAMSIEADSNLDYEVRQDTHTDGSEVEKSGDSGGAGYYFDENGDLVLFGLMTQRAGTSISGMTDVVSIMDDVGFELDTGSYSIPDPANTDYSGVSDFYEGTLIDIDANNNTGTFLVSNTGGAQAQRTVETIDPDTGSTVDSTTVDLQQLDFQEVTLDLPSDGTEVDFSTQDMEWRIDYADIQDQYFTDFREYTSGQLPSDWTDRWIAGNWTVADRTSSPGGKSLVFPTDETGSGSDRSLAAWDGKSGADQELTILVTQSEDTGLLRPMLRASGDASADGETGYYCAYDDADGTLAIEKVIDNTATIETLDSISTSLSMPFWMRFRVNGENLYLKAWEQGSTEPSSWEVTATDTELGLGWCGVSANSSWSQEVGAFGVGLAGASAPTEGDYFSGFSVTIDTTNSPVEEGETLTVDATITNEGSTQDTQDIDLSIE